MTSLAAARDNLTSWVQAVVACERRIADGCRQAAFLQRFAEAALTTDLGWTCRARLSDGVLDVEGEAGTVRVGCDDEWPAFTAAAFGRDGRPTGWLWESEWDGDEADAVRAVRQAFRPAGSPQEAA